MSDDQAYGIAAGELRQFIEQYEQLDAEKKDNLGSASLRTAILVPNTRIAYLARIAFGHAGEANYRVFYNDFAAALTWLEDHEG